MTPILFFGAFCFYSLLVFLLKQHLYPFEDEPTPRPIAPWKDGHEHALIFSPDYWWALRFKARLSSSFPPEQRAKFLKNYVIKNNKANLVLSASLLLVTLTAYQSNPCSLFFALLSTASFIRYLSRSYEISYAFGRDVLHPQPSTTGLTKYERIRLALFSYVEIYVFSASAYTTLPTIEGPAQALTLSLNVGTLTNVGYAFAPAGTPLVANLVFVQVFATLSLVVLSLAAYLARSGDA